MDPQTADDHLESFEPQRQGTPTSEDRDTSSTPTRAAAVNALSVPRFYLRSSVPVCYESSLMRFPRSAHGNMVASSVIIVVAAFVNNVWYIKILSPEDVLRLGKEEAESLSRSAVERIHNDNTQNPVCGLPSLGSLEY
ncbi:UNVERIFIED_CONTAM: hypothetical protein Scaly_0073200 [Sesamum calycinum]|uniref:Uncharacterized protein n=1 Tax=Sesamum calycinum TaxID=2727403 RepID=A0AAW2SUX5_9LAMI